MSIVTLLPTLLDKALDFIPNPAEKERAKLEIQRAVLEAELKGQADQREINKVEAASSSFWVSGWRPGIGWTCVAGFSWAFLLQPIFKFSVSLIDPSIPIPVIETDYLMEMTVAMLGMGTLRTVEKVKKATS